MVEVEGAALQHLKAKPLTFVSIYIHGHDRQRKLSSVLHLETLSDGKQRLVGAQAWERQAVTFVCSTALSFC